MTEKKRPGFSKALGTKDIARVLEIFSQLYPEPKTELNFSTPFELLIATILSAQTTDRQVNTITAVLFKKYSKPGDFSRLSVEQIENEIKSCGLYKNKARNILKTSKILIDNFSSKVPDNLEDLLTLPGVGQKTANVVLANVFGKDVIAVDTHVFRVSNRIGLASSSSVEETEQQLMKAIPKGLRNDAHHWLIFHGRNICHAKNPKCSQCPVNLYCLFFKTKA